MSGAILVISGPSGSGKSSLCNILMKEVKHAHFSLSTTTRPIREGEEEGVHYHFVGLDEFKKDIDSNGFLEWAEVHGNYYGTSKKKVLSALKKGKLVIFDIDVQGFERIKKQYPDITTSVFITTPSQEILQERLMGRGSDAIEAVQRRILHAVNEMGHLDDYDYVIVNEDFDKSAQTLISVARSAMVKSSIFDKEKFIKEWIKS